MKRRLLFVLIVTLFSLGLSAQVSLRGEKQLAEKTADVRLHIYPNPATDYISLSNDEEVDEIIIYNLVGRLIRQFKVEEGGKYRVSDLSNGMYLVRFFNDRGKLLSTQRLSKR